MYSNGINMYASSYKNLVSSSGSIYVPVKPSAVIYSQFDYVHGTAAGSGQNGVPLSRVRILNTLINQLMNMKQKPSAESSDFEQMSDEQKDQLIQQYQDQIRNAVAQSSQPATYGLAGLLPEAGSVISITA